jgi:hypothetical protein
MSENAVFVDGVDQFITGFSAYMCVAAVGALLWHTTQLGTPNNYTILQVQQMMLAYYALETGSNDSTNTAGMSLPQEQDMYNRMGLSYTTLPITATSIHANDIANVTAAIRAGYLVAVCGAETGFRYASGAATGNPVPYTWTPTGNHCIAITGIAPSGNFLVRDMAALTAMDNFTPDTPQEYDNSSMVLISGLAIIPSWLKAPVPPVPAVPSGAKPSPATGAMLQQFTDLWNSSAPLFHALGLVAPAMTSGIAGQWLLYMQRYFVGPPLTPEIDTVDWNGNPIKVQMFAGGFEAQWDVAKGTMRMFQALKEVTFA